MNSIGKLLITMLFGLSGGGYGVAQQQLEVVGENGFRLVLAEEQETGNYRLLVCDGAYDCQPALLDEDGTRDVLFAERQRGYDPVIDRDQSSITLPLSYLGISDKTKPSELSKILLTSSLVVVGAIAGGTVAKKIFPRFKKGLKKAGVVLAKEGEDSTVLLKMTDGDNSVYQKVTVKKGEFGNGYRDAEETLGEIDEKDYQKIGKVFKNDKGSVISVPEGGITDSKRMVYYGVRKGDDFQQIVKPKEKFPLMGTAVGIIAGAIISHEIIKFSEIGPVEHLREALSVFATHLELMVNPSVL